jgi:hypothetical protein
MRFPVCALAVASVVALRAQDPRVERFESKIRPVLATKCYACHSRAAAAPQGGLLLDSAAAIAKGGNSGAVLVAGDPAASLLVRAIRQVDKNLAMPPGAKLPEEIIAAIEEWIREGAVMPADRQPQAGPQPALWSLRPVCEVAIPQAGDKWARNEVDRFIAAGLAAKGLTPSAEADRRTLIRRVAYDLTGLPPSAEEIEAFENDASPDAYGRLIDRLLASPRYGERYARYWLDVARYADAVNNSVNTGLKFPWSYTYRDWVIRSFNEDLPYDKFLIYQIAADRIAGLEPRHLAALGFLSLGREFPKSYPETVDDRIDAVTRGFLGLTVACARCHDHKYDPIPAKDYYSLYGIFANIRQPDDLPAIGDAKPSPNQQVYERRLEKIRADYQDYRRRRHAEMVKFFHEHAADYEQAAKDSEGRSATDVEELARDRQLNLHVLQRWRKHRRGEPVEGGSPADVPLDEFELIYTEGDSNNSRALRNRYQIMQAQWAYDGAPPRAMAVEDTPRIEPAHVFLRGNPNNLGAPTPPRNLTCLGGEGETFRDGSGRLELARKIADGRNPLTARVMVNRIWMWHFGAGLVRTPSDFGTRGDLPTHPELLDFLARRFVESGWSIKSLHRLILTSATYRQASADREDARRADPENLLLWRMNRRRLDIESLRDSMLLAAGRLDLTMGGVPVSLTAQPAATRRSVYGYVERGRVPAMLSAFDYPSPDQHAPMRYVTTVPQQALFFLNSPFVAEQARHLAARASGPEEERIQALYRMVFGRSATPSEIAAARKFFSMPDESAPEPPAPAWRYGVFGADGFVEFPVFDENRWQGGHALPAPVFGKATIRATGGEPGEGQQQAVVRRWISPGAGKISIEGTLRHNQGAIPFGDGVRGRIASSRLGGLAEWTVNGSSAETKLSGIAVEAGDAIDFIVDWRADPENDAFTWAPVIRMDGRTWDAKADFAGPPGAPLNRWERYAQVLFQTNEFAFVD